MTNSRVTHQQWTFAHSRIDRFRRSQPALIADSFAAGAIAFAEALLACATPPTLRIALTSTM
jgi:hypothetical protein